LTKQIRALLTAVRVSGGKDECQIRLIGIERDYWMGTEIGRLGGYSFRGTVTAGETSNQKGGKMRAGWSCESAGKKEKAEEEGGTPKIQLKSFGSELAAFVLALRGTPVTKPMHYLRDNLEL